MDAFTIIKLMYSNINNNDTNRGSMDTMNEVITRLKFIGLIKKGEKINVKSLSVQQTSLLTSFWRMFNQENRDITLDFITSTVNRSFEIIQLMLLSSKSADMNICKNLCNDLIQSVIGLVNLQITYGHDRFFCCHLQTLIQSIELKIEDLRTTNKKLFISTSNTSNKAEIEKN
jgi:hypothetical protein